MVRLNVNPRPSAAEVSGVVFTLKGLRLISGEQVCGQSGHMSIEATGQVAQ